jgi:hypothetical protein
MAVGDNAANSYGWPAKLDAPVGDGEDLVIPAPGFDHRYTDIRYVDVRIGQVVFRAGETPGVGVAFNSTSFDDPVTVTVTNRTGVEWPAGDEIYVFCPHLLSTSDNRYDLKEQIWDLQQRVLALEGATKGK